MLPFKYFYSFALSCLDRTEMVLLRACFFTVFVHTYLV